MSSTHDYIVTVLSSVSANVDSVLYEVQEGRSFIAFCKEFTANSAGGVTVVGVYDPSNPASTVYSELSGVYVEDGTHNGRKAYHRVSGNGVSEKWLVWAGCGMYDVYAWLFNGVKGDCQNPDIEANGYVFSYSDVATPDIASDWTYDTSAYGTIPSVVFSVVEGGGSAPLEGTAVFKEEYDGVARHPFTSVCAGGREIIKERYEAGTVVTVNADVAGTASITGIEYDLKGAPIVPPTDGS